MQVLAQKRDGVLLSSKNRAYDSAVATFGERLKALRGELSQEKIAAKLGHKRPSTVQGWERGKVPKPASIPPLAKALGVEPSAFFEGVVTDYDRLRGQAMLTLIALSSLLSNEGQASLVQLARRLAVSEGKQWRDEQPAARTRGTRGQARTSHR